MATSSSSSSRAWSGLSVDYSSPIPYHERPLDYEPAVLCKCGVKTARWISWSNDNPGRRYLKCFFARAGGCDYWKWYEDNMATPFISQLLVDLRDAVRSLKETNKQLKAQLAAFAGRMDEQGVEEAQLRDLVAEIHQLRNQIVVKEDANARLTGRVEKLEKERVVLIIVIVACFAIVLGLMFSK
ncbi:unnamed protein product [Urochloa decumbens]|uniref:GRF-type domain-containing protein n=1 Tax=Urochloa decumbens TaxID=240449 RepID=A0ABC8VSB8_9POAL